MSYISNDLTRRLCASAYLNPLFRRHVIDTVIHEELRAIAPNPGVNVEAVVAHVLNAHRIKQTRDFLVAGIVVGMGILTLILRALNAPPAFLLLLSAFTIVAAIVVVILELWTTEVGIVAGRLSRAKFDPNFEGASINDRLKERLKKIEAYQVGNIVIYSGFSPFSGSGINLGSWSFLVSIDKAKGGEHDASLPSKVVITELYEQIDAAVEALQLPTLTIRNRLYLNGRDVRAVYGAEMNPLSAPVPQVDEKNFAELSQETSAESLRYYKSIHVESWQGELILSMYYRLQKRGNNLFVEVSFFLLCPVSDIHTRSDSLLPSPTFRQGAILVVRGLVVGFLVAWFWYVVLGWKVLSWLKHVLEKRQVRREAKERYDFDYGARTSIREHAASTEYRRYFQKLDKEYFSKALDKTLLESILAYLHERDIDTSELRERTNVILNEGILVTGGKFEAESVAVGAKARAVAKKLAANLAPK